MRGGDSACRKALDALEHALEDRPDRLYEDMATTVRCLVGLRGTLIAERQKAPGDLVVRDRLDRVNAILSVVVGGEYPLVGVRENRIRQAREELDQLLTALAQEG
jgi:hypothetical protein